MGPTATSLDDLPPECRFALRALAAGLTPDAIDAILRTTGDAARNPLRTVARWFGGPPPARAAGDEALLAALAGPLATARTQAPGRRPGTKCPGPAILRDLAHAGLDGPILLATAEHAADCPSCLASVVAAHRAGAGPPAASAAAAAAAARGVDLPLVLGAVAGVALVLWYLLAS